MGPGRFSLLAACAAVLLHGSVRAQSLRLGELHRMLPRAFDGTRAVVLGDVDGDGDLDFFCGNASDPSGLVLGSTQGQPDRLYLNDGSGVFRDASTQLPGIVDKTLGASVGDVDGDGDLDLWLANGGYPGQPDRLYLNNGSGVFTVATGQIPGFADDSRAVAMGDVDGDGDLDVLVAGGPSRLYLNNGSGVFAYGVGHLPASVGGYALALGDLDGDGDLDALIGSSRLYNNGLGFYGNPSALLSGFSDPVAALALGDVDGDGDLDALVGTGGINPYGFFLGQDRLLLNNGSGAFTDATSQLPASPDCTFAVALGDVDADGDLDVLTGVLSQTRLSLNDGTGAFTDATSQLPAVPVWVSALGLGDVDGDGDLDLLVGDADLVGARQDDLYLNDGGGVFVDATSPVPTALAGGQALALGDVDGDGDPDVLLGNDSSYYAGPDRLFLNDGTGFMSDATSQLPAFFNATTAVALVDVDGDGDFDAWIGNYDQPDRLYLNSGSGTFTDASSQFPLAFDDTFAVAFGDLDGDGDLDAYVGNAGQDRLYLNDGSGVFTDVYFQLPSIFDNTRAVALGDVDGDGDLDVLIGNGVGPHPDRLHLNDGSGSFTNAGGQLPAILDETRAVALGDVDGDGDLDGLIGNGGSSQKDRLLLNNGAGFFTSAVAQLPAILDSTHALAFGDFDGDGDLDALLGNGSPYSFANAQPDRLYLNDGSGLFTDAPGEIVAVADDTSAVALGDLDGDGDLDAVIVNDGGEDRVVFNLSRQLAWRGIPRIGKPLTLDLYGPAWGAWFLGWSLGTANIPISPLGTLRLAPASMASVLGGLLDAQGRAAFAIPVPGNASLLGVSVYWQAVVVSPARFTNLEITAATNL